MVMCGFLRELPAGWGEGDGIVDRASIPIKFRKIRRRGCHDFSEFIATGDTDNRDIDMVLSQHEAKRGLERRQPCLSYPGLRSCER